MHPDVILGLGWGFFVFTPKDLPNHLLEKLPKKLAKKRGLAVPKPLIILEDLWFVMGQAV